MPGDAQPLAAATAGQVPADGEDPHPHLLGSQRQAGPSGASICIQTSSSQARVMISHKIWFWTSLCRGRLRSPMSLAFRIRSSHRARRRCLSLRARVGRLGAGGEAGEPMAVDVGVP